MHHGFCLTYLLLIGSHKGFKEIFMNQSKKLFTVVSITLVVSLGVGIAIGSSWKKNVNLSGNGDDNNNAVPVQLKDVNWNEKSNEELGASLSELMLPEDEFNNLQAAIYQTGAGILMAQAQGAGLTPSDADKEELKKGIEDKYSREFFASMNADSMKELTKPEFITILSFYNTEAGQKFLRLSPKMIKSTMAAVQSDLSSWLPKTVDGLVAKLKGGHTGKEQADPNEIKKDKEENQNGKADSQ
jgi:hypothetical protein